MSAKEDHENLLSIASRLFGDAADDVTGFVEDGMKRLGYKPRIEWDDPEPQGNSGGGNGGGDFFERQKARGNGGNNGNNGGERRSVGGGRGNGGGFAGEYGS